jgi:ribonucleoside-diphosphate reductase alpha chain
VKILKINNKKSALDGGVEILRNAVLQRDCGEIILPPNDSCRLTLINLYSYVTNPFTPQASFNFELFKEHSKVVTRVMDNIVDLELEKIQSILDKIKEDPELDEIKQNELNLWTNIQRMCELGRRTGLGITAEGDMLAALNIIYGTPEATDFSEKVHKVYATECFRESVNLAKERGAFPIFNYELEKDNPYSNRITQDNPDILEDMKKYGRRNIALMTVAPAGSVSCLTQTTSGIEPAFLIYYTRRRKINPNDKDVRVDFIDEVGDHWQEYNVFHHKFIDWYIANNPGMFNTRIEYQDHMAGLDKSFVDELIEKSPYHKATSNDVDWVEKVRLQGAVQRWIDHSISVTLNIPNTSTLELVSDIYKEGWKSGCKGMTIYRDGSRSGVLISSDDSSKNKKEEQDFGVSHAPKRPKTLDCDIVHFTNKGEKWIAFIGLLEGRPYEIFTGNLTKINLPSNIEKGEIAKHKGEDGVSNYDLYYYTGDGTRTFVCNIKDLFNSEFNDISRMVSAILRHGMPVGSAINLLASLNLDGDLINTWKNGVKRILKRYLKDEEIVEVKGKTCSNCGSINIMMIEGCETCAECGSSKCN